jgi:hypothetical protein
VASPFTGTIPPFPRPCNFKSPAPYERAIIKERQRKGIAKAQAGPASPFVDLRPGNRGRLPISIKTNQHGPLIKINRCKVRNLLDNAKRLNWRAYRDMENPSAEQAIQIIDDLVNKTFNTQNAFARAIEKLLEEAERIRDSVEDISTPLSCGQTRQILQNVSLIIRELGMIEKGFGKAATKAPHPQMTYEIEAGATKQ